MVDDVFIETKDFPRLDRYVEHTIDLPIASIKVDQSQTEVLNNIVEEALEFGNGFFHVISDLDHLLQGGPFQQQSFSIKRACPKCQKSYDELDPRMFSFNSKYGWCDPCQGTGQVLTHKSVPVKSLRDEIEAESERDRHVHDEVSATCDTCLGLYLASRCRT